MQNMGSMQWVRTVQTEEMESKDLGVVKGIYLGSEIRV